MLYALLVLAVLVVGCIMIYNKIIQLRNRCDNAWQTIDTQLQRRNDLIPNLVETVKGYAGHESETLQAVTDARAASLAAVSNVDKMAAAEKLSSAVHQLMVAVEAYPELKANTNFQQLQTDLTDSENRISYARQSFNDCVLNYNNAIQTFPGSLIASIGGFETRQGFEAAEGAREVPNVQF